MASAVFGVQGVACDGCVNAIKRAVASLSGVVDVGFDHNEKKVSVEYDESRISPDDVRKRIEDAGYEASQI